MSYYEPWDAEEDRQARADRGAIKCDCCGGLIRQGEMVYYMDALDVFACENCKGWFVASGKPLGQEDD